MSAMSGTGRGQNSEQSHRRQTGSMKAMFGFLTPHGKDSGDPLPEPLTVGEQVRDQIVHLAVPLRRAGGQEADRAPGPDALARYAVREWDTADASSPSPSPNPERSFADSQLLCDSVSMEHRSNPRPHSNRSASIGFKLAAFFAG